eukprot:c16103_g1_i1.p1 GENE.c16103_g1_i1~~c16103_g1_i1.p1  ORF type:complete len:393 (-),score=153.06 c16103_g1_i1:23-1201(-)
MKPSTPNPSSIYSIIPKRIIDDFINLTPQNQYITGGVILAGVLIVGVTKVLKNDYKKPPIVIATWRFGEVACKTTARLLIDDEDMSVAEAVETGIHKIELDDTIRSHVGFGGLPNAKGIMEHEAAMMDGRTLNVGAVVGLQSIGCPIKVARCLMRENDINILFGKGALDYALKQGFQKEMTISERASEDFDRWRSSYHGDEELNVLALLARDIVSSSNVSFTYHQKEFIPNTQESHDTLAVIAMGPNGDIVVGTSTSGSPFKSEGRVGDAPLVGSGFYADNNAGAAAASGDGEEIMKFCVSHTIVELMREGMHPSTACKKVISRIKEARIVRGQSIPLINVIAMDKYGRTGASSTISHSRPFVQPDATTNPHAFQYAVWEDGKCQIHETSDS